MTVHDFAESLGNGHSCGWALLLLLPACFKVEKKGKEAD